MNPDFSWEAIDIGLQQRIVPPSLGEQIQEKELQIMRSFLKGDRIRTEYSEESVFVPIKLSDKIKDIIVHISPVLKRFKWLRPNYQKIPIITEKYLNVYPLDLEKYRDTRGHLPPTINFPFLSRDEFLQATPCSSKEFIAAQESDARTVLQRDSIRSGEEVAEFIALRELLSCLSPRF